MKCRVFKKEDGSIAYNWPSEKYQDRIDDCKIPDFLKDLPFVLMAQEELPREDSGEIHEMLYFDGECKRENLKQDKEWVVCLMPVFLIRQKHLNRLNQKLDENLAKESPDPIIIARLQREKEKERTDREWYEQALRNLDERIAGGEPDKPVIREKLKKKIEELKGA